MVQRDDKLSALAQNTEYAKLFQTLAKRERERQETRLDTLAKEAGVDYHKVAMPWARALVEAQAAELIYGRRGKATRLAWTKGIGLTTVGQLAGVAVAQTDGQEFNLSAAQPEETKALIKEAIAEFLATLQRTGDGKP